MINNGEIGIDNRAMCDAQVYITVITHVPMYSS